jgi:hypothetical protein
MDKTKQGISVRGIAREWGISVSYVSTFLKRAGLGPFSDGSYDLGAATAARTKYTRAGKGQRKFERAQARREHPAKALAGVPICEACGDHYIEKYSRNWGTPTPSRYCSPSCEQDVKDGFTSEQIANRREKGIANKQRRYVQHNPKWTPPPKPTPIVRTCSACGGHYDMADPEAGGVKRDLERFCSDHCEHMVDSGLTREEIRRHYRRCAAEDGETSKEVPSDGVFDWVKPDGSPK